jgi:hypothetical protein
MHVTGRNAMVTAGISAKNLSDAEHGVQLRRAVVASTVGSVIESYDFLLYVLIAPLVFAKLYFPSSDPLVGTLQAFGIYAVGFISRPLGAAFFGHYGDRIGRKVTLIATLLITGLATFAVGFVPGYASIGIWGAIILTGIRFIQGIGVGGEWGGATLVAMEWAKTNAHRGFITAWPQWGAPAGCVRREYRRPHNGLRLQLILTPQAIPCVRRPILVDRVDSEVHGKRLTQLSWARAAPWSVSDESFGALIEELGSHTTRCWREMDSNYRSPVSGNTPQRAAG